MTTYRTQRPDIPIGGAYTVTVKKAKARYVRCGCEREVKRLKGFTHTPCRVDYKPYVQRDGWLA